MQQILESYRVIHQMKAKRILFLIMMPILGFEKSQIFGLPPCKLEQQGWPTSVNLLPDHFSFSIESKCRFLVADTRLYTLLCRSVRRSIGPMVHHISKLWVVFALHLLPNRPRLDCRVSGHVLILSCMTCMTWPLLCSHFERYLPWNRKRNCVSAILTFTLK